MGNMILLVEYSALHHCIALQIFRASQKSAFPKYSNGNFLNSGNTIDNLLKVDLVFSLYSLLMLIVILSNSYLFFCILLRSGDKIKNMCTSVGLVLQMNQKGLFKNLRSRVSCRN